MRQAQSAPNKYSFPTVEEPDFSMMIEEEIHLDTMEESQRARGGAAGGQAGMGGGQAGGQAAGRH